MTASRARCAIERVFAQANGRETANDPQPPMTRCCWECKKLSYESGVEGFDYSEVTPGPSTAQPILKCIEGHWEVDFLSDSEHEFRTKIMTATACVDFIRYEVVRG